jgi:putative flippase GtrA
MKWHSTARFIPSTDSVRALLRSPRTGSVTALLHTLRAPDSGALGQGARFALVGCVVAAVYLLSTTVLAVVVGMPFQAALAIGMCLAIVVHFTLQRVFVWANQAGFALPFHHQIGRYLLVTGTQYGLTAASVALLPGALGLPIEVVYVGTVILTASINFLVFRNRIFHATPATAPAASVPLAKPA